MKYIAKIYDELYPANGATGLIIYADSAEDALDVFKVRFPNWENMNFEIIEG